MSKLTRAGIAHDLSISPYELKVVYDNGQELTFVFSSELYRRKFESRIEEYRDWISNSLTNRFGFKIINYLLADIKLYTVTETRGFLIKGKEDYKCLSTTALIGETLTSTS